MTTKRFFCFNIYVPVIVFSRNLEYAVVKEGSLFYRGEFALFFSGTAEGILGTARERKADLIVTDLDLPDRGADDLCREIRSDSALKSVPFIIVCECCESVLARCRGCGASAWLQKPVSGDDLIGRIREFLSCGKREGERAVVNVSVRGMVRNDYFTAVSMDISRSGLLIETDIALSRGNRISCSLSLKGVHVEVAGEIARVSVVSKNLYQYGIRFIGIDDRTLSIIEDYVSNPDS